jgi:hypothetical protein
VYTTVAWAVKVSNSSIIVLISDLAWSDSPESETVSQ